MSNDNPAPNGSDYNTRLTRIEGILEVFANRHVDFEDEHKRLLTAQVLLTDQQRRTDERMDRLAERMEQLAQSQIHTDERINALVSVMDGLIRKGGPAA